MIDFNKYLIAMESDSNTESISQIINKYPIKYPKEMSAYQFDQKGKFENGVKTQINNFFNSSHWDRRFNNILEEVLLSKKYKEKVYAFCESSGYKISDLKISFNGVDFNDKNNDITRNQLYINISFDDIDRYDAPGFPKLIIPILNDIVKSDIGKSWIVIRDDYYTYFTIYRPLDRKEIDVLNNIKRSADVKKKELNEKRAIQTKLRNEKNQERIDQEIKNSKDKFFSQSLKDQAFEIIKYFSFEGKYYYHPIGAKQAVERIAELNDKKSNSSEKIFKFNYTRNNTYDIWGKSLKIPMVCYVIADEDSNYTKLKKVYFLRHEDIMSESFETYTKKKVMGKKF